MSRTSLRERASPARLTVRTDAGTASCLINSAIAEGTVLISSMFAAADIDGNCKAFSASTTQPPQLRGANISKTERSKLIEVEASTEFNFCGVKKSRDHCRKAAALQCVIATPFGVPVEPEV